MINARVAQGMGESTLTGSTITNTGMGVEDHMAYAQDLILSDGVVKDNDLVVEQNPTPNMTVVVQPGTAYILNSSWAENSTNQNRFWSFVSDAGESIAITANTSGSARITSIFARFDSGAIPDDAASNVVTYTAVDGTPAANPTPPATPSNCLRLADITVNSGATSIVTADIVDRRRIITVGRITGPEGFLINGQISRSTSGSNLVVSIKTLNGEDPSVANPVVVRIGNEVKSITSPLSVAANSGTNWANLGASETAGHEVDLFCYLGVKSSTGEVFLGWSRVPNGNRYSEFSSVSTNERLLRSSTTSIGPNDIVVVVGRFNAQISSSNTWSTPSPSVIINRPIFQSRWLTWAPSVSASGSMTATLVTNFYSRYKLSCGGVEYNSAVQVTTAGSASNTIFVSTPFSSPAIGGNSTMLAQTVDSGSGVVGLGLIPQNNNLIGVRKYDSSSYGLGSGRQATFRGFVDL